MAGAAWPGAGGPSCATAGVAAHAKTTSGTAKTRKGERPGIRVIAGNLLLQLPICQPEQRVFIAAY
jgi:hypothetical protein